jgi:hypothetical protein
MRLFLYGWSYQRARRCLDTHARLMASVRRRSSRHAYDMASVGAMFLDLLRTTWRQSAPCFSTRAHTTWRPVDTCFSMRTHATWRRSGAMFPRRTRSARTHDVSAPCFSTHTCTHAHDVAGRYMFSRLLTRRDMASGRRHVSIITRAHARLVVRSAPCFLGTHALTHDVASVGICFGMHAHAHATCGVGRRHVFSTRARHGVSRPCSIDLRTTCGVGRYVFIDARTRHGVQSAPCFHHYTRTTHACELASGAMFSTLRMRTTWLSRLQNHR